MRLLYVVLVSVLWLGRDMVTKETLVKRLLGILEIQSIIIMVGSTWSCRQPCN